MGDLGRVGKVWNACVAGTKHFDMVAYYKEGRVKVRV